MIIFTIMGEPRSRQSFRFATRDRSGNPLKFPIKFQPKGPAEDWKNHVRAVASEAMKGQILLAGALVVCLDFFLTRPASLPKKIRHHKKKPDQDNLEKPVYDAMQGIVYRNDSQIAGKHVFKFYGDPPCLKVSIEEVPESEELKR